MVKEIFLDQNEINVIQVSERHGYGSSIRVITSSRDLSPFDMVNIISKMFTLASNVKRLDKIHYWIYDDLNHLVHNPGGRQGSSLTPESRQGKS